MFLPIIEDILTHELSSIDEYINSSHSKSSNDALFSHFTPFDPRLDSLQKLIESNTSDLIGLNQIQLHAKASAFLVATSLQKLIHFTTPIPSEMHYWSTCRDSSLGILYYTIMTSPNRIFTRINQAYHAKIGIGLTFRPVTELKSKISKLSSVHARIAKCIGLLVNNRVGASLCLSISNSENNFQNQVIINRKIYHSLSTTLDILFTFIHLDSTEIYESSNVDLSLATPQKNLELIKKIINLLSKDLVIKFHQIKKLCFRPGFKTRSWIPITVSFVAFYFLLNHIKVRWNGIQFAFTETYKTSFELINGWILEPFYRIYETIRYKESKLRILGAQSLQSDLDSLERMVVLFAKDNGVTNPKDLLEISEKTLNGDLTLVLEAYENEMRTPVLSVVRGNLIRPLLIQIQKAKVDAALSLSALDRLLRSNELNFAFLALLPVLSVVWITASWIKNKFIQRKGHGQILTFKMINASTRQVERMLNQYNHHETKLSWETRGYLLIEISHLRRLSFYLKGERCIEFQKDLKELDYLFKNDWSVSQGLETCKRLKQ